jgi:F-type H+-transporting ATPase subunit gamma
MPNLKEVKNRIVSVSSTQQITKAMKMVAASKLRRAQDQIIQMRPYAQKLATILKNVSSGAEDQAFNNEYSVVREENKILLVVVTSDKGLAGAFNSNVFKATNYLINTKYAQQHQNGQLLIMPIGKKAYDYYKKRGYKLVDQYAFLFSGLSFDQAKGAAEYVMDAFKDAAYDKVEIIYNEFKNVATQIIRYEQFLPIEKRVEEEQAQVASNVDYIFEPSKEYIIEELIPKSLKIQFYKALLESNASEHGARMTAMDKATDNAGELLKSLKLTYNRSRQAAITTEILEIVAGAEALAKG